MKRGRSRSLEAITAELEQCKKRIKELNAEARAAIKALPVEEDVAAVLQTGKLEEYKKLSPGLRASMREVLLQLAPTGLLQYPYRANVTKHGSCEFVWQWGLDYTVTIINGSHATCWLTKTKFGDLPYNDIDAATLPDLLATEEVETRIANVKKYFGRTNFPC